MDGGNAVISENGGRIFAVAGHGLIAGLPLAPRFPFVVRDLCERESYDILYLHFPDPPIAACSEYGETQDKGGYYLA
jgi:hypothetical protein